LAVCRDCGTQVGFLKKRCASCQDVFDKQQEAERAAQAEKAAQEAQAQRIAFEASEFESAKRRIDQTFDKFEGTSSLTSPNFKVSGAQFDIVCTNGSHWYMRIWHKPMDWQWLHNNRTIILFDDGSKLVQNHGTLFATDVGQNGWDQVIVYEELHVTLSKAVPFFIAQYEAKKNGTHGPVDMRIGTYEYPLSFEVVRTVVAMQALLDDFAAS
jgi:hypothetical protein